MRRTLLAIGATAVLLVGGCGTTRPHAAPGPTVATVPLSSTSLATTPTTVKGTAPPATTTDPSTTLPPTTLVPTKITVAYVDEVLAKLNHVYGDAVRDTVAAHRLTASAIADISAIYSVKLGAEERSIFVEDVHEGLGGIRQHPGDRVAHVTKLLSVTSACIYARIRTNYNAVDLHRPVMPADEYIELRRKKAGQVSSTVNPTPWIVSLDLTYGTPTYLPNQCHAD